MRRASSKDDENLLATADIVHDRTCEFLRLSYRSPKHAARDLDAAIPTAIGWFAGKPMSREHFWRLIGRHGKWAHDFIIGPALGANRDPVAEVASLAAGLQAAAARLREQRV